MYRAASVWSFDFHTQQPAEGQEGTAWRLFR
jgi:hypothetical protein